MKLSVSKNANINYLAKIIEIDESNFSPHPNADKLKLVHIFGNTISTGIDSQPGLYVYFPVECVIDSEFLKFHNLYRDKTLNNSPECGGFFEAKGRVRCVKLRGLASEGFIMPLSALEEFCAESIEGDITNTSFDTIGDKLLVWKYVIKLPPTRNSDKIVKAVWSDKIVENQFRFHIDTPKLQDNLFKINPEDLIQITAKLHGTSLICCKLNTYRKLNWFEKLLKRFKMNIKETEYVSFCSSRKVIKSPEINPNVQKGYYDYDIWTIAHQIVDPYLTKGMTIYAEIVGYQPNGKPIQGKYDYGCIYDPKKFDYTKLTVGEMYKANLFNIYIYRITLTNEDGKVYEFSAKQVQDWCNENGLNVVPEVYYGRAKDLFDLSLEHHWHDNFIDALRDKYLEKDSIYCNNKVPEEGIVIRRETSTIDVYKFKSKRFLTHETEELDKGNVDIETNQ